MNDQSIDLSTGEPVPPGTVLTNRGFEAALQTPAVALLFNQTADMARDLSFYEWLITIFGIGHLWVCVHNSVIKYHLRTNFLDALALNFQPSHSPKVP